MRWVRLDEETKDVKFKPQTYEEMVREAEIAVSKKLVKRYTFVPSGKVVWVVVGRHKDYIVIPEVSYCSCDDFFYRVMSQEKPLCYHLLALRMAMERNAYEEFEEEDSLYYKFIREWGP